MKFLHDYFQYIQEDYVSILGYMLQHMLISFTVIILAVIVSVPLATYMTKMKSNIVTSTIFNIANVFQTIPNIALLAMVVPILGIGFKSAVFALLLYSLLPLLRNTYAGINAVDPEIIEAAKGMGFKPLQRLAKIEFPAAIPYVMSGIRVSSVYIISWTTLAALIGAGGLGDLVLAGIGYNDQIMIFTGTILAIVIAVILDLILGKVEKKLM